MWGDQAYRGQRAVIRQCAPRARDFVNRRYRHRGVVDQVEQAKNRTKSKVRAKVEHPIGVIKQVFGFAKVRYRGLKKNLHRLLVTAALANLYTARRQLSRASRGVVHLRRRSALAPPEPPLARRRSATAQPPLHPVLPLVAAIVCFPLARSPVIQTFPKLVV